ncbi:hypothetical protein SBX64_15920 [Vibrio rhizosphaerae]|uniref:Uncharacterized protein n=1 Tax=Vibrio rhizosphaerae TaxID=398736 RepID=A0ABU4IZ74_9VIBR|nr:hypothetical protein [Vibrio rhizosphaerae]MDW6094026.1 hypothetical protein [Vibrio rhizosphaerae]
MTNIYLARHIWRSIEQQAKTVADSIECRSFHISGEDFEQVNELELKHLHSLIAKLEEKSPN